MEVQYKYENKYKTKRKDTKLKNTKLEKNTNINLIETKKEFKKKLSNKWKRSFSWLFLKTKQKIKIIKIKKR